MARVNYPSAVKREAVALARIIGAEAAAKRLKLPDWRTVQRWMVAAGEPPGLDGDTATWERLFELSATSVEAELVGGKLSAVQKASIAGIAQRNLDKLKERPAPAPESAVAAKEAFYDWLIDTATETDLDPAVTTEAELDRLANEIGDALDEVCQGLLVVANAEDEAAGLTETNGPHRRAILSWYSGRTEVEAGDVVEWAQGVVRGWLEEFGTFRAWNAAEMARERRETLIRHRADVLRREGGTTFAAAVEIATLITDEESADAA